MKQLVVLIICSCSGNLLFGQQINASQGNTYALIIGVSKYLDPQIPQLQYANRDAEIFAEFLRSRPGGRVPKENIRLLVDSAANTGAVYDAVYWLKNICKKDDKVFIYFSGHGDLEDVTMYNNGFLICYDSPPVNYVRLALSIDYLNDIANTISLKKQANVIMITDACHSGKLTEKMFKGNFLAADQLRKVKDKEIRITSSAASQLSNERADWGGGRGVFSYYLVNGLKGMATTGDLNITLNDLKIFLDSALKNDMVLKADNIIQTPVINGNGSFVLSQIDSIALSAAQKEIGQDLAVQRSMMLKSETEEEEEPATYFYNLIKEAVLEELTDSLGLDKIPAGKISFTLIDSFINSNISEANKNKLNALRQDLSTDKEALELFNNRLATAFDEAGQRVITQYLRGDAAELERRRYYNANYNGYDVYPRMFQVALKLTSADNIYYHNNLKVKLHYFTGVAERLKIPLTAISKRPALIEKALKEQEKALALEKYAAYIYNELGVLYVYKNNDAKAEKYFKTAAAKSPGWAIPLSNLADLYTEKGLTEKAMLYADSALALQPAFQDIYMSYGLIHEKKGELLQAEESFQKSIKLNSRHFLPYERLGMLYLDNGAFAFADSMYFEAAERKKGFLFDEFNNPRHMKLPKTILIDNIDCSLDKNTVIHEADLKGNLVVGLLAYRDMDLVLAESALTKVIAMDPKNPLAFHYLAKTLMEQQRLPEAELVLKKAIENYLSYTLWAAYVDSVNKQVTEVGTDQCIDVCFRNAYYKQQEDHELLASLYETWGRFRESENYYQKFIEADPSDISGYTKLAGMYIKAGRYNEAESVLTRYMMKYTGIGVHVLKNFYENITNSFPGNAEWSLKAGIFHYNIAKQEPGRYANDTKSINTFTKEVVYNARQINLPNPTATFLPRLISYGAEKLKPGFYNKLTPFTHSISFLKRAIENLPYDENLLADINAKIGELYVWQGLPDSAVHFYETSIQLNPANIGYRFSLIEAYGLTYRYKDALAQLDSLAAKNKLDRSKQLVRIAYAIQDGDRAMTEKLLLDAEASEINALGESREIITLKARYSLMINDVKATLDNYTRLHQLNKQDSIVNYNIARLHAMLADRTKAFTWLQMALNTGFNYKYVIEHDPAFKKLRSDRKWKEILEQGNWKKYNSLDETLSPLEDPASTADQ